MALQVSTIATTAIVPGATQVVVAAATNLKPGVGIIVDNGSLSEYKNVALTYTGSTTVPIDGTFQFNHAVGASVQWDPNNEPGLTGS